MRITTIDLFEQRRLLLPASAKSSWPDFGASCSIGICTHQVDEALALANTAASAHRGGSENEPNTIAGSLIDSFKSLPSIEQRTLSRSVANAKAADFEGSIRGLGDKARLEDLRPHLPLLDYRGACTARGRLPLAQVRS